MLLRLQYVKLLAGTTIIAHSIIIRRRSTQCECHTRAAPRVVAREVWGLALCAGLAGARGARGTYNILYNY